MTANEFILAFVSIIIGLAVADWLNSVHKLLLAWDRVRWDWLTIAHALLLFFTTLVFWWATFGWYRDGQATIAHFLPRLLFLAVSFLMIASALPDAVPARGINLRDFYMRTRVHRWALTAASVLLWVTIRYLDRWRAGDQLFVARDLLSWTSVAVALLAIWTPRVWVQAVAIAWISAISLIFNLWRPVG